MLLHADSTVYIVSHSLSDTHNGQDLLINVINPLLEIYATFARYHR